MTTWRPSQLSNSRDERELGLEMKSVEWIRAGAEQEKPGAAALTLKVDIDHLQANMRACDAGRTVYLPGLLDDTDALCRVVAALLPQPVDGRLDRMYVTETDTGTVWFDARTATIRESPAP